MTVDGDWICPDCGCRTELLHTVVEPHGEEHIYFKCNCGGEFENAVRCSECGEVIAESNAIREKHKYYCCNCKEVCEGCGEVVDKHFIHSFEGERLCEECIKELTSDRDNEDIYFREKSNSFLLPNERPLYISDEVYIVGLEVHQKEG